MDYVEPQLHRTEISTSTCGLATGRHLEEIVGDISLLKELKVQLKELIMVSLAEISS